MQKNTKNELQEQYQRQRLPLPKYHCQRHGGSAHEPLWQSTVTISDGRTFTGEVCSNKSLADMSAAERALSGLTMVSHSLLTLADIPPTPKINLTGLTSSTAVLVDVENLPKFIEEMGDRIREYSVYAFVGEHHCLSDKNFGSEVIKVLSPSTRSDGTDTCMQVYMGMLLAQEAYDDYIIVTRDHYGSALVEMITTSGLGWNAKSARLVTKVSQL